MADDPMSTLAEWRKIEQAATPGPWEADVIEELGDRPVVLLPDPGNDDAADLLFQADAPQATEADAEFIATARTAMPLLIAAVEAVLKLADGAHPVKHDGWAEAWDLDPAEVREAIGAALKGEATP